jgi:hypothetical protein
MPYAENAATFTTASTAATTINTVTFLTFRKSLCIGQAL